jgi:hypothetical protein
MSSGRSSTSTGSRRRPAAGAAVGRDAPLRAAQFDLHLVALRTSPWQEDALADEIGDEAVGRAVVEVVGVSHCWMRPSCMTPISSAMAKASCWSWVTRMAVVPDGLEDVAHLAREALAQVDVEVREGLVEQQQAGLGARARASATRCCWPPESSCGNLRRPRGPDPPCRAVVDALRDGVRGALAQAEGDVVGHAQVRKQGVVLEHHADAARSGGSAAGAADTWPLSGSPRRTGSKPAMARSTVVLPQPEGPSRQPMRPASSSRESDRSSPRRCGRRHARCGPSVRAGA